MELAFILALIVLAVALFIKSLADFDGKYDQQSFLFPQSNNK